MTNREIAEIFSSIGDIMDILGENRFKVLAYRRAAENIMSLGQDLRSFWRAGTLQEIPGIGQAIAEKIDELLTTCLLYTSPSPRDRTRYRMPSSA